MEQENATPSVTTRSAGIRFGLISGVVSIVYFVAMTSLGINIGQPPISYISWIFPIVFVWLAHNYYKTNGDGLMTYGQGIGIAFWMSLIGGLISSVFTYVYIAFIDPSFIDMIQQAQIEAMQEKNMSQEQIDQAMKFAGMFTSPGLIAVFGFIGNIITTVIVALLVTIITKNTSSSQQPI